MIAHLTVVPAITYLMLLIASFLHTGKLTGSDVTLSEILIKKLIRMQNNRLFPDVYLVSGALRMSRKSVKTTSSLSSRVLFASGP